MKTRMQLMILAVLMVIRLGAQEDLTTISATINPTEFQASSSNPDDPYTIITWNDASAVTAITAEFLGYYFEMEEGSDYKVTPVSDTTARLTFNASLDMIHPEQAGKFGEVFCYIQFDVGDSAVFTILPEIIIWYSVIFWVEDTSGQGIADAVLTFNGETFAPGNYDAGLFLPGLYTYSISRAGYLTTHGVIDLIGAVSMAVTLYPGSSTGMLNHAAKAVRIFPNPATDYLNLQYDAVHQAHAEIYSMTGQLVVPGRMLETGESLDIRVLSPGHYILRITAGKEEQVSRFVKR